MVSHSKSQYLCQRCGLPLMESKAGLRHALNHHNKFRSCGMDPVPVERVKDPFTPGTVITIWRPAGTVTIGHEPYRQRFRPGSFDHLVDQLEPLRRGGEVVAYAVITGADVAHDGSGVLLTMQIIDFSEKEKEAA